MDTYYLNKELLKLRQRVGDMFVRETGLKYYVNQGDTNIDKDGNVLTSDELTNIWNDAVREFIRWMVKIIPMESWGSLMPGYIIIQPDIQATVMSTSLSQGENVKSFDFIGFGDINGTDAPPYKVVQISGSVGTKFYHRPGGSIGVFFPMSRFFEILNEINSAYANQTNWTIGVFQNKRGLLIVPSSGTDEGAGSYHITFLKCHRDLTISGDNDLNYDNSTGSVVFDISDDTLETIQVLAEREYMRRRQFESATLNQNKLNESMQLLSGDQNGVRSK